MTTFRTGNHWGVTPQQVDGYWIRCTLAGPHDAHEDEHTGLTWFTDGDSATEGDSRGEHPSHIAHGVSPIPGPTPNLAPAASTHSDLAEAFAVGVEDDHKLWLSHSPRCAWFAAFDAPLTLAELSQRAEKHAEECTP